MKVANSHWYFSLEQDAVSGPQAGALRCAGGGDAASVAHDASTLEASGGEVGG